MLHGQVYLVRGAITVATLTTVATFTSSWIGFLLAIIILKLKILTHESESKLVKTNEKKNTKSYAKGILWSKVGKWFLKGLELVYNYKYANVSLNNCFQWKDFFLMIILAVLSENTMQYPKTLVLCLLYIHTFPIASFWFFSMDWFRFQKPLAIGPFRIQRYQEYAKPWAPVLCITTNLVHSTLQYLFLHDTHLLGRSSCSPVDVVQS